MWGCAVVPSLTASPLTLIHDTDPQRLRGGRPFYRSRITANLPAGKYFVQVEASPGFFGSTAPTMYLIEYR